MPKEKKQTDQLRLDAERLADIFTVLQRCFIQKLSKELARGHVSFTQYLLLGYLGAGDLTMTEIAHRMEHTTAAATGLIDRLEKLNLATRTHSREDRRKIVVQITPEGTRLVGRIRADMVENLIRMMKALTPHEQTMWLTIYEKILTLCQSK